jgi:hypothetical protein
MGILSTGDEDHIESVVYFLSEALRAAIEAGDNLQQTACAVPQVAVGMSCAEIADGLALFRERVKALWSEEVLMVAKITRARELVKELRTLEPELRPEIDTFRLATVNLQDLQEMLLPDAQHHFNGGTEPKRFLEQRGHGAVDPSGRSDPIAGYKIAGHTDVRLLVNACEVLHFGLAARYGFDSLPSRVVGDEPLLLDQEAEGPLLLTDFGDILGGGGMRQWTAPDVAEPTRVN